MIRCADCDRLMYDTYFPGVEDNKGGQLCRDCVWGMADTLRAEAERMTGESKAHWDRINELERAVWRD